MKKNLITCSLLLPVLFAAAQEYQYNDIFFTNSQMKNDYFFSTVTAKENAFLKNTNGKLPVSSTYFHTPGNSLMLQYKNSEQGTWTATVFKEDKRGMDHYKKANHLSFWLLAKNKEQLFVSLMKTDSTLSNPVAVPVNPANKWQQVKIALTEFNIGSAIDLNEWIAVKFSSSKNNNPNEQTIYLDDIECINDRKTEKINTTPVIVGVSNQYPRHIDIVWKRITNDNIRLVKIYRSTDNVHYSMLNVQQPFINRYTDFTGKAGVKYFYKISFLNDGYEETKLSPAISGSTKEMNEEELLTMVQEAAFRYYWEAPEPVSGLARENFPGRHNMIAAGASGFGMMALIAGTERKFITRKQSADRFLQIVNFLEKADKFHGAFPHFMDGPSGKVEPYFGNHDNGADLVETAFLMEGLLCAKQYFSSDDATEKTIRSKIEKIWKGIEWSWFRRTADNKFLLWHWSPDQGWVINHLLIGWNETMVVYLLAIASPTYSVPASMYYTGWANQDSVGQWYRAGWSQTKDGSKYSNGKTYQGIKLDVGVSSGGPLFFTHYSFMGPDPHYLTDKYTNYFSNNQNIALINYKYCVQNPKGYKGYSDSSWGLTASLGPIYYTADEPVLWQDWGKITPTGAIGSFPYTPEQSMKALKNFYYNYGEFLWGEYGFRDAFDLTRNWCSGIYMGLNQAPMVVMIENYRTGLLWKLFMSNPDIQNGFNKLNVETAKSK